MYTIRHFGSSWSNVSRCPTSIVYRNLLRVQSTSTMSMTHEEKKDKIQSKYPSLNTKFDQHQIAYRYRHNLELLRGYIVYRLFSVDFLVNNQEKIFNMGRRVLGDRFFKNLTKLTTFGHFVGGENPDEIKPVIQRLLTYNVKPILDYSVESDEGGASSSLAELNRMHNENTEKFIECIKTSRDVCGENNLIAIKVTALIQPSVLKKFNVLLQSIEDRSALPSLFEFINRAKVNKQLDAPIDPLIESSFLENQKNLKIKTPLTREDFNEIYHLLLRLNQIAQACVKNNISIMVDAEQTYFQTAINYLANELQRYYNTQSVPYIYGTYQCYLKETLNNLKEDLAQSKRQKYIFAAKLVRGAYMEQERRLAREKGYEDPINPTFEATSKMYHTCLDEVFKNITSREANQVRVMVASHNEDTIRYAIQQMKEFDIRRGSCTVSFASLYGMSDYITFALANSGYKTYKYLPYGPLEALQPYLFRRAQENRSIFEKADKDRRLHFKALKERLLSMSA